MLVNIKIILMRKEEGVGFLKNLLVLVLVVLPADTDPQLNAISRKWQREQIANVTLFNVSNRLVQHTNIVLLRLLEWYFRILDA